jgi:hypothetical protein
MGGYELERECRIYQARLAQSVEHETLNLRVVGSSPTLGASIFSPFAVWTDCLTAKKNSGPRSSKKLENNSESTDNLKNLRDNSWHMAKKKRRELKGTASQLQNEKKCLLLVPAYIP